jgi:hypothetical protein
MKLPNFKNRHFVNKTIATALVLHLVSVMLAARFESLSLTRLALASGFALYFVLGPIFWLWHRATQRAKQDEGLADVRAVFKAAQETPKYNVEQYFVESKGLFIGLDADTQEPVYVPWNDYRKAHMQVLGSTGFGKGVATCMFLAQSLLAGECVVVLDPKDDEFAPNVLYRIARQCGASFNLIDLRPEDPLTLQPNPPQFNLFKHCTKTEIEEMVMTAFEMGEKGGDSDFYRLFDRKAARDVCTKAIAQALATKRSPAMRDLVKAAQQSDKIDEKKGQKFLADLEELAELETINTSAGLDLKEILSRNAVLYIVGSIRNVQVIRAQQMLLLRILQIIEKRDRTKKLRPIAVMLDELKYILSTAALQALGTVRDKSCHIMLAHQANGDLDDCGGLDPNAVRGAVLVNTSLKLIYRATEPETLEWASTLSGTIVVKQETSHMQQGMFHAAEGQYRQEERALITPNHILAMPKQTGMFFGAGLCRRIQVSTLPGGPRPAIVPAMPEKVASRDGSAAEQNPSHAAPAETPCSEQNANSAVTKPTSGQPETTGHSQEIF